MISQIIKLRTKEARRMTTHLIDSMKERMSQKLTWMIKNSYLLKDRLIKRFWKRLRLQMCWSTKMIILKIIRGQLHPIRRMIISKMCMINTCKTMITVRIDTKPKMDIMWHNESNYTVLSYQGKQVKLSMDNTPNILIQNRQSLERSRIKQIWSQVCIDENKRKNKRIVHQTN